MALSKANARAFLSGGSRPPITDAQFDKLGVLMNAEGLPETLEALADYTYDLLRERVVNKLHGMKQDQVTREEF